MPRLDSILARWLAALDFGILFSTRLSRRPGPWIALHRLLSVPLLAHLAHHWLEIEHGGERVQVRCRARSSRLSAGLLTVEGGALGTGATAASDDSHDLDAIQVHPWAASWWRRRGWLTVPAFVRYRAPIASVPPPRLSKSLRGNLARARRSGFRPRRGRGGDWDQAMAMAESWGRARFGSEVWIPPKHAWRRMRRHGRLIMIGDGSRDVAMAIVVSAGGGNEAWFASLGIARGDHVLLRAGALTAAYAAAVEEARRIGSSIFDSGRCSPRADDPIAAYKRGWGLGPTVDPLSPLFALRARTPAGTRLLAALPVWTLGRGAVLRRLDPS